MDSYTWTCIIWIIGVIAVVALMIGFVYVANKLTPLRNQAEAAANKVIPIGENAIALIQVADKMISQFVTHWQGQNMVIAYLQSNAEVAKKHPIAYAGAVQNMLLGLTNNMMLYRFPPEFARWLGEGTMEKLENAYKELTAIRVEVIDKSCQYNIYRELFPNSIVAGFCHFKRMSYDEIPEDFFKNFPRLTEAEKLGFEQLHLLMANGHDPQAKIIQEDETPSNPSA